MAAGPAVGRKLLSLLVVAALVAAVAFLPLREWLDAAVTRVESLGPWGPVALVGLYVVCCVFFVPGSVVTLAAGAVFGLGTGTVAVFVGATLGATAAFLVGRYLARGWVASKVEDSPRFAAIDAAVGREGFKIVALTRLSPVFPFSLLNYAYGLTAVKLKDYVLGSIGMLPGTLLYVYLGAGLGEAAAATEEETRPDGGSVGEQVFFYGGLLVALGVTLYVTRVARAALDEAVGDEDEGLPEPADDAS